MSNEITVSKTPLPVGGAVKAVVPQDFDGAYRIARTVCAAGMAPNGMDTPEKATVAVLHGLELGFTPMAALQSIAMINGRPSVYGDGALALVEASGMLEDKEEKITGEGDGRQAYCRMKRKGKKTETINTFSVADAKKAGLWGKKGPWTQYPERMLKMRARSFTIRDAFSDLLRGLSIAEDIQDVEQSNSGSSLQPPTPPKTENQDSADNGPAQAIDAEAPEKPSPPLRTKGGQSGASNSSDDDTLPAPSEEAAVEEDGANTSSTDGQDRTIDVKDMIDNFEAQAKGVKTIEDLEELWVEFDFEAQLEGDDMSINMAKDVKKNQERRINRG